MKLPFYLLFLLVSTSIYSQSPGVTSGQARLADAILKNEQRESSIFQGVSFESIGPTVMSGRVVDLAVNPIDPTHFFVAYASGGLWETQNNGHSFLPLFDNQPSLTIGDIAVNWNDTSIWVGTGEVNSSRSSYSGTGVYFSTDKGISWENRGLLDSHHIGRIVLHPTDPNTLWIASLGPLYSNEGQAGVFMSEDQGQTWEHVLNQEAGAVDLVLDPNDSNILYAALWDRNRKAWNFKGHGSRTGVYQSTNKGRTWALCSGPESEFARGSANGRIGLSMSSSEGKSYLYAIHDNQERREAEKTESTDALKKEDFLNLSQEGFFKIKKEDIESFLLENNFPEKYSYDFIKTAIKQGELKPDALHEYLTDANNDLFDTPVIGAEVYSYDFLSSTWNKTHEGYIDDLVYSYGYYFGLIAAHPRFPKQLYIAGVPLLYSSDAGHTWTGINPDNVHADHHALWINPDRKGHLINGNDGGINISYDNGEHYVNCNSPAVGQFYTVAVDQAEPYNVYGGLQDNGVWKGPNTYQASDYWHKSGDYPYEMIMGGDGMQIAIDTRDNSTVYTGYQFGHYTRLKEDEPPLYIHPAHELGEKPLRWNWQTPIHLSSHNQDILYMASNRLHRSMDQGETWEAISPDLTEGAKKGNVPFGTITSIDESPVQFGLLYTGSDDGKVYASTNGGHDWKDISTGHVSGLWVSRVEASHHDKNRVYATLNGYRNDVMDSYIYVSNNQGTTWTRIGKEIGLEPVNVILEDQSNENILYVGTDHGLYCSIDQGKSFSPLTSGLIPVPVHDLVIQDREQELIVGTHGRSIYKADVSALRALPNMNEQLHLFSQDTLYDSKEWGKAQWSIWFGHHEPSINIEFYEIEQSNCSFSVQDELGTIAFRNSLPEAEGLQRFVYNLQIGSNEIEAINKGRKKAKLPELNPSEKGSVYLPAGNYEIKVECSNTSQTRALVIEE